MGSFVGTKAANSSVKSKLNVDSMNEDSKLRSVVHVGDFVLYYRRRLKDFFNAASEFLRSSSSDES
jgi:hypothetical protein